MNAIGNKKHLVAAGILAIDLAKGQLFDQAESMVRPPTVCRNNPCPCNSGKKFKACCWKKNRRRHLERV